MMTFKSKILQFKLEAIRNSFNDKLCNKNPNMDELKKNHIANIVEVAKMLGELPPKDRKEIWESINEIQKYIESK